VSPYLQRQVTGHERGSNASKYSVHNAHESVVLSVIQQVKPFYIVSLIRVELLHSDEQKRQELMRESNFFR